MSADLALINATVRTMNPHQPIAQAVAIRKNKVIKVGTNEEIKQLIGKKTRVNSMDGKTVIPGLIDTHIHVADFGRYLLWLDLSCAQSIKELQNLLKEKAKQIPIGSWIIGRGWNHNRLKEKRFLNITDLNAATPDNPVILYHEAAMICAVNSKALKLASVTEHTAIPLGGSIDKDAETGELTGILRDSATNLIWQVVAEPTSDELLEATALACKKIAQAGITSVHWMVLSENELSTIQRLHAQGKLLLRVSVIVPETLLEKAVDMKWTSGLMLRLCGAEIAVDGYLDSKTAALSEPYSDDTNNCGKLLLTEQFLADSVEKVLALDVQPIIHAMGDKAIDLALKVIEKTSDKKIRFRIEQAAVLNKELIKRLKKQKIVISVQPKVIATEFSVWSAIEHLGDQRAKWLHPLKTLLSEDVKIAGGSDCPMEPLNPLLGVQDSVTRQVFPEQRLSIEEAFRLYTIDAAFCACEEKVKGSIEKGKLADLTILSDDPFAVSPNEIETVKVDMTIINGKVVYS